MEEYEEGAVFFDRGPYFVLERDIALGGFSARGSEGRRDLRARADLPAAALRRNAQRIDERAKTAAAEQWIRGRGWDHTKWSVQTLPSRRDLDAITAGHPAIFTRVDGHICVVNTAALEAAGITK
jgi:hypothetical protein